METNKKIKTVMTDFRKESNKNPKKIMSDFREILESLNSFNEAELIELREIVDEFAMKYEYEFSEKTSKKSKENNNNSNKDDITQS